MSEFLFTSESVSEGHPDKVADQISDAVLDAILEQDPTGRVAAETLVSTGLVVLAGEITTTANVDFSRIARETVRSIGYNDPALRFDADGCAVMVCYGKQSPDIAQGVDRASDDYLNQGAGDQGLMFGYACDETPTLMPFPIYYAHRLVQRQSELRRDGRLPFLRPDAKSQVTVRYHNGHPVAIDTVVADLADFRLEPGAWDGIVSIFSHMPPAARRHLHREVVAGLRPGGVFVLEAYRPEQLDYGTGGPPTAELMMRLDALRAELAGLEFDLAAETTRDIREGTLHHGRGAVVQILAHKPE